MKVLSIGQNYQYKGIYNNPVPQKQIRVQSPDCVNISFGDGVRVSHVSNKFDPYFAVDFQLDELAEICHKNPEYIHAIELRYHPLVFGLGAEEAERKKKIAKEKLIPRVNNVIEKKNELLKLSKNLSIKAALGDSNTVEQKNFVQKQFIMPLQINSRRNLANITNGIIIYGTASENDKKAFEEWLKIEASEFGTGNIRVEYKENNPEKSLSLIKQALENAKQYNQLTDYHTIIFVDNIDNLLTSYDSDDLIDYIDYFKTLVEDSAKKYHATFVIQTQHPLKEFDSAIMGDHRFGLKLNLNGGITESEKVELSRANDEIDRLNRQAEKVYEYFSR